MKFKYLTAFFIILIINACSTVPKPDIDSSGEFSYKGIPYMNSLLTIDEFNEKKTIILNKPEGDAQ